jgi:hypothetical protein
MLGGSFLRALFSVQTVVAPLVVCFEWDIVMQTPQAAVEQVRVPVVC